MRFEIYLLADTDLNYSPNSPKAMSCLGAIFDCSYNLPVPWRSVLASRNQECFTSIILNCETLRPTKAVFQHIYILRAAFEVPLYRRTTSKNVSYRQVCYSADTTRTTRDVIKLRPSGGKRENKKKSLALCRAPGKTLPAISTIILAMFSWASSYPFLAFR